jgi:hypothetical protein
MPMRGYPRVEVRVPADVLRIAWLWPGACQEVQDDAPSSDRAAVDKRNQCCTSS